MGFLFENRKGSNSLHGHGHRGAEVGRVALQLQHQVPLAYVFPARAEQGLRHVVNRFVNHDYFPDFLQFAWGNARVDLVQLRLDEVDDAGEEEVVGVGARRVFVQIP